MKHKVQKPLQVPSISALHALLNIEKPLHPLISIVNLAETESNRVHVDQTVTYPFYTIALLKNENVGKKYGQQLCDFDGGVLTFAAPRQLVNVTSECTARSEGFLLIIHPDYLQSYPLAAKIKKYGFFSYSSLEALHLSDKEEFMVMNIIKDISKEIHSNIDTFSQDVIISYIDLLLNYTNRFYNRQFITRKSIKNELLSRFDIMLKDYFDSDELAIHGLPNVQCMAKELSISPNYLSDILKMHTGLSTQQHIHEHLIEEAKEMLCTTTMSVSEIAYHLGFGYPQSFNKLFKSKTNLSPLEYRHSLAQ